METKMALIMMALIMCAFAFGAWQGILEPRHALPLQQENIFHGYAHQDSLLKVQENIQRQQDIIEELLQRTRELSSDDDREAAKIKRAEAFSRLLTCTASWASYKCLSRVGELPPRQVIGIYAAEAVHF